MKKVYLVFFNTLLVSALILGDRHPGYTQESGKVDNNFNWTTTPFVPAYADSSRYMDTSLFTGPFDDPHNAPLTIRSSNMKNTMIEDQYTAKSRLASKEDSPIKWSAGAFFLPPKNQPSTTAIAGKTYETNKQPASSLGVFGHAAFPITDLFRVTGGLHYIMDKISDDYGVRSIYSPGYDNWLTTYKNSYFTTTYKAGVEYDLKKDSTLYARIAASYKANGNNTTASPSKTYKPEKLLAYEAGIKNRLWDNRVQINAEGYLYNYKDYQVQFPLQGSYQVNITSDGGATNFQQYIADAESVKTYGADIEFKASITSNDQVDATLAYQRARYEKLALAVNASSDSTPSAGAPFVLTDTQAANASEWSGTLGYQHMFGLPNGGMITVRGQSIISAGSWSASTIEKNLENAWQEGLQSSDANISYAPSTDVWLVNAWINNIGNDNQKTTVMPPYRMTITDPRTYGATLTVKW